jgi:hypothetical protein
MRIERCVDNRVRDGVRPVSTKQEQPRVKASASRQPDRVIAQQALNRLLPGHIPPYTAQGLLVDHSTGVIPTDYQRRPSFKILDTLYHFTPHSIPIGRCLTCCAAA